MEKPPSPPMLALPEEIIRLMLHEAIEYERCQPDARVINFSQSNPAVRAMDKALAQWFVNPN